MKKMNGLFLGILLFAVLAGGLFYFSRDKKNVSFEDEGNNSSQNEEVNIQNDFGGKIVYTTDSDQDEMKYGEHCAQLGGEFNSCGNPCEPSADDCASVCAYTCENVPQENGEQEIIQYEDLIYLETPLPEDQIESPLEVSGQARGSWFFEASFPVVLTDWNGKIIAESPAMTSSDWMTEEYVSFKATLEFENPYPTGSPDFMKNGNLILQKANPSGLPENDDTLEIRVEYKQKAAEK